MMVNKYLEPLVEVGNCPTVNGQKEHWLQRRRLDDLIRLTSHLSYMAFAAHMLSKRVNFPY